MRARLDESNSVISTNNKERAYMQEGLKKAFMRGVCALNFEAMNILTPQGKDEHMNQLEQEMLMNIQKENA